MSSKSKRRRSRAQQRGNRVLGLINYRGEKRPCGICGVKKRMSQSHVPPRCAGNEMLVKRYHLMVNRNEVDSGRQDLGGIHLYGLCGECNTQAGQYDSAYGDFADALRPNWVRSWQIEVMPLISMDPVAFDPGAVVRSILLGMCATGSLIREHWPSFPSQVLSGSPLEMPAEMRLYLALASGLSARVAGPMAGRHIAGPNLRRNASGKPMGINALASVYFPPLAWELALAGETTLTLDGWADVSSWTTIEPGDTRLLTDLVPALPAVCHPWHHPTRNDHWAESLSTEITPIIEGANVEGGPPDPRAPSTLGKRAYVSTDEFSEVLRRLGLAPSTGGDG